jgi:hypothetical protein
MTWANLLESYCVGDRTKVVYGFDNWEGFEALHAEDGRPDDASGKVAGGFSPGKYKEELLEAIAIFDTDRFIPWKPRIKLIEGDIAETVPRFLNQHPGIRFSLVHFDCDLYIPTRSALESIWPRISRGGVLIFDEYAIKEWPGETKAVDEFLEKQPGLQLKTLPWTNAPSSYLIKP